MNALDIKELDLDLIRPSPLSIKWDLEHPGEEKGGSKISVIGKAGTGKSFLITSLLYEKRHLFPTGLVFSGTDDSNHHFSSIFPSTFVFNKLDLNMLTNYIKRQKVSKQYTPNPWSVLIIDDCMDDPKMFNLPLFHNIYKNGRHWNMFLILSQQYSMDIKPVIPNNVDGVFILREPNIRNRRSLWENYAGIIPDFNLFCDIMDNLTTDYTALYIHNSSQSNRWQDNVFWYRAQRTPRGFKMGCKEYWDFHFQRFNPEYKDPFDV